jgi:hypothetical protein
MTTAPGCEVGGEIRTCGCWCGLEVGGIERSGSIGEEIILWRHVLGAGGGETEGVRCWVRWTRDMVIYVCSCEAVVFVAVVVLWWSLVVCNGDRFL